MLDVAVNVQKLIKKIATHSMECVKCNKIGRNLLDTMPVMGLGDGSDFARDARDEKRDITHHRQKKKHHARANNKVNTLC